MVSGDRGSVQAGFAGFLQGAESRTEGYLLRRISAVDGLLFFTARLLSVRCYFLTVGCTTAKTTKRIADQSQLRRKTVEVQHFGVPEKPRITSAAELIFYAARWSETQGVTRSKTTLVACLRRPRRRFSLCR